MSTLEDELKAMEAQLAELGKEPEVPAEVVEDKPEEEVAPEVVEPEKPVEEAPKPAVEEEDAKGAARLRIEAKKERERADKLAAELAAEREAKREAAPEEERQEAFQTEILEVIQEKKRADATKEFLAYEEDVRAKDPAYDAVAREYAMAMMTSVRLENPRLQGAALQEAAMNKIINRAAQYAAKGYDNPVEALYNEAKELGFTGASYKADDEGTPEKVETKPKPDMKKVGENRSKSPGMAGTGGGDAQGQLTKKYAVDNFTLADFEKLSQDEAARLMYS
jgi:hypothetical protein